MHRAGRSCLVVFFFFFNDTATTEIYTLSLHDALPICETPQTWTLRPPPSGGTRLPCTHGRTGQRSKRPARESSSCRRPGDRKSTRLNSSHLVISYAVFCLKKKNHVSRECVDVQ